jgi:hypothetical protein
MSVNGSNCIIQCPVSLTKHNYQFDIHGPMHCKNILIYIQQDATLHSLFYLEPALHVSVVPPPIIRSANNCIYSIWYLSHRHCYLLLQRQVKVTLWQIPDAVDTVLCASDDGWCYHPKHVQQFPDKINCVTLHLVGYILEGNVYCLLFFIDGHWFNQINCSQLVYIAVS